MGKLANPYQNVAFEHVSQNAQGRDEYGYRTVDGLEEIVHIPSGKSNMTYHEPEKVTFYENCTHRFRIVNMGIREVECVNPLCRLLTSFHPGVNFKEEAGKAYIILNHSQYEVII